MAYARLMPSRAVQKRTSCFTARPYRVAQRDLPARPSTSGSRCCVGTEPPPTVKAAVGLAGLCLRQRLEVLVQGVSAEALSCSLCRGADPVPHAAYPEPVENQITIEGLVLHQRPHGLAV